jgi:hypothetical protein
MDRPAYSVERDRLGKRLAELARKLADPTPKNVERVRAELDRLACG